MSEPRCRVCIHADRTLIDQDVVGGMPNAAVAAKWGLSKDGVRRHRQGHLSPALKGVITRRETAGAVKALDRIEDLYTRASAILDAASAEGKASLSLAAIRELRGITELLARVTGELDERPTVQVLNLTAAPEWVDVRGRLLAALAPFPDARLAAAAALSVGGGDDD